MTRIVVGLLRWILRNTFSLVLILAVLLIGNWLHTQWDQAETAKQATEQLREERPNIGVQLLKASQELELQLRQSAATDAGLQKLQESVASSIKAKTTERDKLKTDHPVAINIPATPEFMRVTVLDMELSMLEQARTKTQVLTSLLTDITADLPPDFSTGMKLVKSAFEGRSGHEEAIYGRADHWVSQASRGRYCDQGSVQEAWL